MLEPQINTNVLKFDLPRLKKEKKIPIWSSKISIAPMGDEGDSFASSHVKKTEGLKSLQV